MNRFSLSTCLTLATALVLSACAMKETPQPMSLVSDSLPAASPVPPSLPTAPDPSLPPIGSVDPGDLRSDVSASVLFALANDGSKPVEEPRRDRRAGGPTGRTLQHQCLLDFLTVPARPGIYWWRARRKDPRWLHCIALSCLGRLVTNSILLVTLVEKFAEGGWMTVVITGVAIAVACSTTPIMRPSEEKSARQTKRWAGLRIPKFPIRHRSIHAAIPLFCSRLEPRRLASMHWSACSENFRVNFETASS